LYLGRRRILKRDLRMMLAGVKKGQRIIVGSRRLAWIYREEIWRRKRERENTKKIEALKEKNGQLLEFLQKEGPFPLLALPDELISGVFSLLPMKDRLRARVNKRLNEIEVKTKYHVNNLWITEESIDDDVFRSNNLNHQTITFIEERAYSSECIKRLARNVSVGAFSIELTGSDDFHREVYNLIKEFEIGQLYIRFENDDVKKEIFVDSFLIDVLKTCKTIDLTDLEYITGDGLFQVYKLMITGAVKVRFFYVPSVSTDLCLAFLRLLGISFRDGKVFSKKLDIEVYEIRVFELLVGIAVFDGTFEMRFIHSSNGHFDREEGRMAFELHESIEALEKKKNGQQWNVKLEIIPE
ncbi:hypothetical protein PMAYCL1PPCAC_20406, partial [Pristionchus mayeri]